MADAPKKGFLSKLFGAKNSGCCNVTFEEVPEEPAKAPEGKSANSASAANEERAQTSAVKPGKRRSSCCG